jgi:hypothetical protein
MEVARAPFSFVVPLIGIRVDASLNHKQKGQQQAAA